jgi:hypothetical protein
MGIEVKVAGSAKAQFIGDEPGAFFRLVLMAEEDRRERIPRPGGFRWFRSENVVCIEHFRRPHVPGQKAGRFGWVGAPSVHVAGQT